MSQTIGIGHRRHSRVLYRNGVELIRADGSRLVGTICNVSMDGIFVRPEGEVKAAERFTVCLALSDEIEIRFEGEVVRVDTTRNGVGIRIRAIEQDSLNHLYRLVTLNFGHVERISSEIIGDQPRPEWLH